MAWSPCPLKRFPGARQPDHQLPACSHRFQIMAPRATRVSFTPTTARETRHVHRTHHLSSRGCPPHRYSRYILSIYPPTRFSSRSLSLSLSLPTPFVSSLPITNFYLVMESEPISSFHPVSSEILYTPLDLFFLFLSLSLSGFSTSSPTPSPTLLSLLPYFSSCLLLFQRHRRFRLESPGATSLPRCMSSAVAPLLVVVVVVVDRCFYVPLSHMSHRTIALLLYISAWYFSR